MTGESGTPDPESPVLLVAGCPNAEPDVTGGGYLEGAASNGPADTAEVASSFPEPAAAPGGSNDDYG